jgi:hypothetical protein
MLSGKRRIGAYNGSVGARLFLAMIVFASSVLLSQVQGRAVRGTVIDERGKPVEGASVRLKDTSTLQIRSARTGADGTYRFPRLDPSVDYELRATHEGRSSSWVRLSRFDEGSDRVVDLRIR